MPVIVTNYSWTQSSTEVIIKVPLNGVPSSHVDLFACDSYIKAHYQPFLFEAFLLHDVTSSKSKCYLHEGIVTFQLAKTEDLLWEELEKDLTKQEKLLMKKEVIAKSQEQSKIKFDEKITQRNELDRYTVRQAMEVDNRNHKTMDERRDKERNMAMDKLEDWRLNKNNMNGPINKNSAVITEIPDDEPISVERLKVKHMAGKSKETKILQNKAVRSEYLDKKMEEVKSRVLPPIRGSSELLVKFSSRVFPTPSRESQAEEEAIWLKNITDARRATELKYELLSNDVNVHYEANFARLTTHKIPLVWCGPEGFVSEDLRPEEQDPQWCKEKGDEFFRAGNFLGAVSAYTHGIKLSPALFSLYANRAATQFALGNFNKCANDCSTALDLMKPVCEGNRVSRARCLARRAAALARLGYLSKAIDEMKAAAKLMPTDEKLKTDIYNMERAWEQNPDSE